jgi:hypothetical protein
VGSIPETNQLGYVAKATRYARDVVESTIPACSVSFRRNCTTVPQSGQF